MPCRVISCGRTTGAGSASQRAIGTGVMGGMITATLLAIFFVPVFFVVVRKIFKGKVMATAGTPPAASGNEPTSPRPPPLPPAAPSATPATPPPARPAPEGGHA